MSELLDPNPAASEGGAGMVLGQIAQSFAKLPLWAQVLACARVLQRYVLALRSEVSAEDVASAKDVAAAMRRCARLGGDCAAHRDLFRRAVNNGQETALTRALRFAVDATRAAESALDFPIEATVTHSALRAIEAIRADTRVLTVQLRILLASDIDQLRFACNELCIGGYDALPEHVFQRLVPVHALTLVAPRRTEPEWR